jgi:protein-S-isoprenylcysteine O-methyltransferase Ste14
MTSTQSKQGGARVRFPPPFVYLGLTLAAVVLERGPLPLSLPLGLSARLFAGVAIAGAAVALVLNARVWFVRTGQHPAPWRPTPELVVQGIYRYTRNPMYLGLTLFQVGLGVALGNGWIALLSPLSLLVVHFLAVRPEEAYLRETFGESYGDYSKRVRRYL